MLNNHLRKSIGKAKLGNFLLQSRQKKAHGHHSPFQKRLKRDELKRKL